MASRKETQRSESSTNIKPNVFVDDDDVFTVDFSGKEECSWIHLTEWTCVLPSRDYEITFTRRINEHLCNMMRHFDRPPGVKLVRLRNPEQKVILVFGHDTEANAFNMFNKFTDVRNTVLSFLHEVKIHVEDMKVRVRLTGTSPSTRQQDQEYRCLFDPKPDYPEGEKSETKWFCMPNTPNFVVDNETSNSRFSQLKKDMRRFAGAGLSRVTTGSVIFTFYHGSTEDALEMMSKHEEVRAMILECLREIDSTVKDIQMEVQLQDFIDPRPLPGHGDLDKRYVDKQEYDKVSEQVATLKEQLQEMKEKERAQLAGIRLSVWETRPVSPQPSDSSGFFSATDTMTEAGDEDDTDLSEPEGVHGQTGDASKPKHTSGTVTDLRRPLADMRQELKATTERMHRLEISHQKGPVTGKKADSQAWSEMEALKPGRTPKYLPRAGTHGSLGPHQDTRATPTPARRDARADTDLRDACREGKLEEVKRILDTGRADVNSRDDVGRTPVLWAARGGHSDVVELLVSRGADVSLVDGVGNNILHWACVGGDRTTVEFVLSLDAVDVNSRGDVGRTPVMAAALRGHRDVVELLVSRGADVSLVDGVGNNILHWACRGGDRTTVEFVLSLDAVDVNARNNDGQTAADVARDWGHRQLSDLLVSRGTQCCVM